MAVIAAIRPKSCGVSSHSRTTVPSASISWANTGAAPVFRSISTRAWLRAVGVPVRGQQRGLDRREDRVERDLPLALQGAQRREVDVHLLALPILVVGSSVSSVVDRVVGESASSRRLNSIWTRPGPRSANPISGAVDVEHDAVVVGGGDPPGQPFTGDQPAHVAPPVPGQGQRTIHTGRADLELVLAGQHLAAGFLGGVQRVRDLAGTPRRRRPG